MKLGIFIVSRARRRSSHLWWQCTTPLATFLCVKYFVEDSDQSSKCGVVATLDGRAQIISRTTNLYYNKDCGISNGTSWNISAKDDVAAACITPWGNQTPDQLSQDLSKSVSNAIFEKGVLPSTNWCGTDHAALTFGIYRDQSIVECTQAFILLATS